MADPSPKYRRLRRVASAWAWFRRRSADLGAAKLFIEMIGAIVAAVGALVGFLLKVPGPAWFALWVVLMAVSLFALLSSVAGLLQTRAKRRKGGPSPPSAPSPVVVPPVEARTEQEPKKGPELVGDRWLVTAAPEDLSQLFREHMEMQAKELLKPFIGQWMKVSGAVDDVGEDWGKQGHVIIQRGEDRPAIFLSFTDEKWLERLAVLKRGDRITVLGRVRSAGRTFVILDECELVPP